MADGQQNQGGQQFNSNDYYLKQQAARMLSAIQKGYSESFPSQVSMTHSQSNNQTVDASMYMNHQVAQQQQQMQQQNQQQGQSPASSLHIQVQHQQLQQQLQQVQQAQQQFQQMQQLAQMQQQYQQQYPSNNVGNLSTVITQQSFTTSRRGRKPTDKKKRKRHTFVKRPCTAYLYFVSKYRETLKEAGEVVPKAKIITQACAEKWRNMTEEEKEPFLELARRDRERWQKDKALEKKPRDPNRPKRPPSAYFLFLAEFRKSYLGKSEPAKEITKKAGEAWNNLTDQEKAPYYREAQLIRTKWERDLEAYKQANTPQEKNGPLSRTSSMQSDTGQLEMGSDSSPIGSSPGISQIDPSMLQSSSGLLGQTVAVEGTQQSSPGNAGPSSMPSDVSYGYPHHMVGGHSSGLQFPGR